MVEEEKWTNFQSNQNLKLNSLEKNRTCTDLRGVLRINCFPLSDILRNMMANYNLDNKNATHQAH